MLMMLLSFMVGLKAKPGIMYSAAFVLAVAAFTMILGFSFAARFDRPDSLYEAFILYLMQIPVPATAFGLGRICAYVYEERNSNKVKRTTAL